jgi:hypothetical protein
MSLTAALLLLPSLSFDELELLRDFTRMALEEKVRRHGLPRLDEVTLSPALAEAIDAMTGIKKESERKTLLSMIRELHTKLMPQEGRRSGEGYIELKWICKPFFYARVEESYTGEKFYFPQFPGVPFGKFRNCYGPYAYVRVWATGGDYGGTAKKLKSKYIGKWAAEMILAGQLTKSELLALYREPSDLGMQERSRKLRRDD